MQPVYAAPQICVGEFKSSVSDYARRLEELEAHHAPCLLWDSDRLRIVWANEAGLKLFGAETLFDLLDRPFDSGEEGAASIRAVKAKLGPAESRKQRLRFPSAGPQAQLAAVCSLHPLPDGRDGVLVTGDAAMAERLAALTAEGFLALPTAAVIMEGDGRFAQQNHAAAEQLSHLKEQSLSGLLGEDEAVDLLARVHRAGLVSEIRAVETTLGRREFRVSARRLARAGEEGPAAVLMFEDVTERRALERSVMRRPRQAAAGEPTDSQSAAAPGPALAGTLAAEEEAKPADHVPGVIRTRLDALDHAILILRAGQLLFANRKALALLNAQSVEALRQNSQLLAALASTSMHVAIKADGASETRLDLSRSMVPWNRGPAEQVTIRIASGAEPPARAEAPEAQAAAPDPSAAEAQPQTPPAPATAEVESHAPPASPAPEAQEMRWKPDDAELSAILDTASDGIITLDGEGRIRSFSAGAEAIFGQPKAVVLGRSFTDLLTPDTQKIFRDYLAALTDSGLAAVFNDGREVSANVGPGKHLPLFLTISRFNVEARESEARPAFCAVVRDITQWKQTEAELRDAKEKAERTSRQKSEFLARISHELRTPLNAILGFSEVMRLERFGKLQNEKYRDYVSDIHASGAHLLSLINDLLDLSKVEAGKLELNFTSVNLNEVTDHAMRLLAERAQQARVSVKKNFPPKLPNVVADLRSMRQIMINLLSNAIKFTDPGGQVTVGARLSKAGELILRVKDTGVGMSAEELKGALEPFRRVASTTRPEREGTGLGLPLTKALTEANRASFSISSEPGKGTAVEIVYPTTRVLAD
jgi:PAS domain S-box-containing protein